MTEDDEFSRLPPQSIEAEKCLVASLFFCVKQHEFDLARAGITGSMFLSPDHQICFEALCDIWREGGPCDAVILRARLEKKGLLEEIGGSAYLGAMMEFMPSAAHARAYAAVVREKHLLRSMIAEANTVLRRCYGPPTGTAEDIASRAAACFAGIAATGEADKITTLQESAQLVIDRLDSGKVERLKTGIGGIDSLTGGLPLSKFILIGGRPGMGKSLLLKQILRNVASAGVPVGIVSIEETREKIAENCISALSGIPNNQVAYGRLAAEDWPRVARAQIAIETLPFFIADGPVRLSEVEAAVTLLAVQHKCKVIALDYIQCIDAGEQNENREITLVSRSMKAAFKRLDVAGLAAVQLNRAVADRAGNRPALRDLRGSGSLEQDGDLILLLHSDDYYRREKGDPCLDNKLEIIVAKNKDGPLGHCPLAVDLQTQELRDWSDVGSLV